MPYMLTAAGCIYYQLEGEKTLNKPIVMIHGTGCDHSYFAEQIPMLAASRQVLLLDMQGHGKSDKPEQGYDVADFAGTVKQLVDRLGLEDPIILGHSLGGAVALEYAVLYGEEISALILLDPTPPGTRFVPGRLWPKVLQILVARDYGKTMAKIIAEDNFLPEEPDSIRNRAVRDMGGQPAYIGKAIMKGESRWNRGRELAALRMPVLLVLATPPIVREKKMRQANADIEITSIPAGHFFPLTQPEQTNQRLLDFLSRHRL